MKHLVLFFLLLSIITPVSPAAQDAAEIEIFKSGWRKLPRTIIPSGKKAQEMRDARIDTLIREERQQQSPNYARIRELELQKQNQVTPLDGPKASDKAYEYKFKFRNNGARRVISLRWVFVFQDAATGRELTRLNFESKVQIGPGKEKELVSYTDSSPPMGSECGGRGEEGKGLEGGGHPGGGGILGWVSVGEA